MENNKTWYKIHNSQKNKFALANENYIRPALNKEISDCKSLEDFQALAAKRGYKQGWAYYRWTNRQNKRFY